MMRARVQDYIRRQNSSSGNPVVEVIFEDQGSARTEPDSQAGYDALNTRGCLVDVQLNVQGRITNITIIEEAT